MVFMLVGQAIMTGVIFSKGKNANLISGSSQSPRGTRHCLTRDGVTDKGHGKCANSLKRPVCSIRRQTHRPPDASVNYGKLWASGTLRIKRKAIWNQRLDRSHGALLRIICIHANNGDVFTKFVDKLAARAARHCKGNCGDGHSDNPLLAGSYGTANCRTLGTNT